MKTDLTLNACIAAAIPFIHITEQFSSGKVRGLFAADAYSEKHVLPEPTDE